MVQITKSIILAALLTCTSFTFAGSSKDCLLEGTVVHGENAGQETTMVKIHSVSKYDENSNCNLSHSKKMEFKLPHDSRVTAAPSGSEVKYRYQSDETGGQRSEVITVGT